MVLRGGVSLGVFVIFLLCIFYPLTANTQQNKPSEDAFSILMQEALSYFPAVSGRVISQDGNRAVINKGSKDKIKVGMRLYIFKEDVSFMHPVTREYLGKVEKPIGVAEVIRADENQSDIVLIEGDKDGLKDAMFKVSMNKIKVLFYQFDINWFLADHYYQMLKDRDRFEIIDSAADHPDIQKLSEEARKRGTEILMVIDSSRNLESSIIRQRLFWTKDGKPFSEKTTTVDAGIAQSLIAKSRPFWAADSNILLTYQVPSSIKKIAIADLDGDGSSEIILASSNNLSVYQPSTDLRLLWEFQTTSAEQILWVDTFALEGQRRESIMVTVYKEGVVDSYIYQVQDKELKKIAERKDAFIRGYGNTIIEQSYSKQEGFDGRVYMLSYNQGNIIRGEPLKLPERVNIYDFTAIESPEGKKGFILWDEKGSLNLYSSTGVISWSSGEGFGGFSTTFKKDTPVFMIERGEWTIKDRLISRAGGVIVPKRIPILGMAKGLGFKESEIRFLWWNGLSVEQFTLVDKLDGEILDYGLLNDRLIVLCKPIMGVKASNILKGANPFVNTLYVISVRGLYN